MAIPVWLNVSKKTGTGNASVTLSATAHEGRNSRNGTLSVSSNGPQVPSKSVKVNQAGKPLFITAVGDKTINVSNTTIIHNFTYRSNAACIVSEVEGKDTDIDITLFYRTGLNEYVALTSTSISQGSPIGSPMKSAYIVPGNIGLNEGFDLKAQIGFKENKITEPRRIVIKMYAMVATTTDAAKTETPSTANTIEHIITQSANPHELNVTPSTINLVAAGTEQTLNITVNPTTDTWTIS